MALGQEFLPRTEAYNQTEQYKCILMIVVLTELAIVINSICSCMIPFD